MRVFEVMESTIGGTRRHLVGLVRGLVEAGDEVHLCVAVEREPRFRGDLDQLAALGVHVHEIPMARSISPGSDWRHVKQLTKLFKQYQPDVVHTHSSKAGVLGRVAAGRAGCTATVHTPHTFAFLFDNMFSAPKRYLFKAIETHLAKRTARMIAVSEGEAATMSAARVVANERVRVVPNGVDPAAWKTASATDRASIGVPVDAPMVLVAGLLNAAKGQDLAIDAIGKLDGVHLVLAGHGEDQAALESQVKRLGLQARVHLLGWREDLAGLMAAADLLLLPSRWEGMPYVVLEAMAAGKPVLATRVDGARDLVQDGVNGALVDVGDCAGLAKGLGELLSLSPTELDAMGRAGQARIEAGYTTKHMVAATRRVFEEAIGASQR